MIIMGKNTQEGYRKGFVKKRTQSHNKKTGMFMKRDTTTGRFLSGKNTPYKGVRKEKKLVTD